MKTEDQNRKEYFPPPAPTFAEWVKDMDEKEGAWGKLDNDVRRLATDLGFPQSRTLVHLLFNL